MDAADIVDEPVEAFRRHGGASAVERRRIGEINRPQRAGESGVALPRQPHHVMARLGQRIGDRPADAAACPGNEKASADHPANLV